MHCSWEWKTPCARCARRCGSILACPSVHSFLLSAIRSAIRKIKMVQPSHTGERILGIGTDIVEITRIEKILRKHPLRIIQKILHPLEFQDLHQVRNKASLLARRFAMKEALCKALGRGFRSGLYPCVICIQHDRFGNPYVPREINVYLQHKKCRIELCASDEKNYAIAWAMALSTGDH